METSLQTTSTSGNITAAPILTIEDLIAAFIRTQDVKENSRALYKRTLKLFLNWIEDAGLQLQNITRAEIIGYKEQLLTAGKSPLTVSGYLTVVRKFFEWAEGNKYYPNVAKGVKSPRRKQQFQKQPLTQEKGRELLEYFKTEAARNYALVNLLVRTGLRTIEASRANVEDVQIKGGRRVLLVHGKGRDCKDGFVILTDKAYEPLKKYIASRGAISPGEPLFISSCNRNKGGRLSTRAISRICKEGLKAIHLDEKAFTAHSLRHTTAVNILRAGGNLADAQGVLRHANPATTQIYTATIAEEIRLQNPAESLIDGIL